MPVHLLTEDRSSRPSFVRFGYIKKGGPKQENQPGQDLDHFRFDFADRFEGLRAEVERLYGNKPRSLPCVLIGRTADEVFETWLEAYGKPGLIHRCTGQVRVQGLNPETGKYEQDTPCMKGAQADPTDPRTFRCLSAFNMKGGCVLRGRLTVAIPALWGIAKTRGVFTLTTQSNYDINRQLLPVLRTLELMHGNLMLLAVRLGREKDTISRPDPGTGKTGRAMSSSWLLTLDEDIENMHLTRPEVAAQLRAQAGMPQVQNVLGAGVQPATSLPAPEPQQDNAQFNKWQEGLPQWDGKERLPREPQAAPTAPASAPQPTDGYQSTAAPQTIEHAPRTAQSQPSASKAPAEERDMPRITRYFQSVIKAITPEEVEEAIRGIPITAPQSIVIAAVLTKYCTNEKGLLNRPMAVEYAEALTKKSADLFNEVVDYLG